MLRASAVTELSTLCSTSAYEWLLLVCHKRQSHGELQACRLAPVAIDELNLSELYVTRSAFQLNLPLGCASENRQLTGPLEGGFT
jgi:hypothetical protein